MKRVLFTVLLMGSAAFAQTALAQTADDIMGKVQASQKAVKDVTIKVVGKAELDNGSQSIDLDIQTIPSLNLTRINFNAPDALADNVVVIDKNTVSNYLFLTNQVTVQSAKKARLEGFSFDFTRFADFSTELGKDKFTLKLLSTDTAKDGKVYVIEATPREQDLGFTRTRVTITENGWRPLKMQALDSKGKVLADLNFTTWKTNSGLKAAALKSLPKDAQIIKK
ncbi:outer membrane lipoprotein carrier protein LolA [Deinococcus roseus]|uniref:Uncharacterized protein TP-0789 domain-containing protein n=1 Tax=Deinococcus roseus TaxID=392414 RepID=A0ABQ2DG31_9DEIO|nr:outer membrane lipoprotein carrier protein LolA [Deinococcus roseus]GGJ56750.1 hypothetical protein GCM10008938_48610 [Deinococcus roseus]